MKVSTALLELVKESREWRACFRSCCETSAFRLRSQVWQFRDELKGRGHRFGREEVEDACSGWLANSCLAALPLSGTPSGRVGSAKPPSHV
jgi:hypothetical protein